jgi:hypothetical protein
MLEALSFGLAYGAGLCLGTVFLLASFRPARLSSPYWNQLPDLRSDTSGIVAFFAVAFFFCCSEFLRLYNRSHVAIPSQGLIRTNAETAAGLAVSKTVGALSTALVIYLSVNAVTHPATLAIQATHLASWPTEGTLRVIALLLCVCSAATYRFLNASRGVQRECRRELT